MGETAAIFLQRAGECARQAERAGTPAEQASWLEIREGWLQLARSATEARGSPPPIMDGFPALPKNSD